MKGSGFGNELEPRTQLVPGVADDPGDTFTEEPPMRFEARPFDVTDLDVADDPAPAVALRLVRADTDAHPEDAFLREYRTFLRSTLHMDRGERLVADELARAALDQVDGPEGDFARMAVDSWLVAALPARARSGVGHTRFGEIAIAFVTFLRTSGRVPPLAARRLRRAVAGLDRGSGAQAA